MSSLPVVDLIIIAIYILAIVLMGLYFALRGANSDQFVSAGGVLPAWAVGLSIFGTYLSSNTYIGVTGKAYGTNWNAFVFSLAIPIAAWIASKYFVPFYRESGNISAYAHAEKRFGPWARLYMDIFYLLTQLARMASIMFGVSLVLNALTGIDIATIIIAMGVVVTLYTLLGGIEAVIWTDVIQSIVLTLGAIFIVVILCIDVEGGFMGIVKKGMVADKFSLGSFRFSLASSTFWVVMLYGIFINLNNFGIDQSFIQRYHTAKSTRSARRSVWMAAKLYIPVSLLFFFIGTGLWVYYQENPQKLEPLIEVAVNESSLSSSQASLSLSQESLLSSEESLSLNQKSLSLSEKPVSEKNDSKTNSSVPAGSDKIEDSEIADRVLPFFMVNRLPRGITGLLIAALFAAAMSSVDSSLNSSATIIWADLYKRYFNPKPSENQSIRILKISTVVWGILGTFFSLALIGIESLLDTWWQLSGIFAGGMLGLFLLGFFSKSAGNTIAKISVTIGILVISWMTFPGIIPDHLAFLRSPFHTNMIVVVGTLTIFLSGIILNDIVRRLKSGATND
ncbi:MAG: sodium:solute symporter [Cyclobacteriaceae bacterium]|jgi:SSS family solute:Na+ symporter